MRVLKNVSGDQWLFSARFLLKDLKSTLHCSDNYVYMFRRLLQNVNALRAPNGLVTGCTQLEYNLVPMHLERPPSANQAPTFLDRYLVFIHQTVEQSENSLPKFTWNVYTTFRFLSFSRLKLSLDCIGSLAVLWQIWTVTARLWPPSSSAPGQLLVIGMLNTRSIRFLHQEVVWLIGWCDGPG